MRAKVFYPPCQWLDPDFRNTQGDFFCEIRHRHVIPSKSAFERTDEPYRNFRLCLNRCGPDCPDRRGKTRVPTL